MKTILLTDIFSALDFSHTVNKDKYTSKYMNNTIKKRRLGGRGVHTTDRNISENPREKKWCTVVWFLAVTRKDKFIYGYKAPVHFTENNLVPHRQVKHTPLRKVLLNELRDLQQNTVFWTCQFILLLFSVHLYNSVNFVFLVNQVKETKPT